MSGKPDDDLPQEPPAKGADDDRVDETLDLGIAEIMAALSVEAMMEEALEKALAHEKESEGPPTFSPVPFEDDADQHREEGKEAGSHEDVLQAGPAGDEVEDEKPSDPDLAIAADHDTESLQSALIGSGDVGTTDEPAFEASTDLDLADDEDEPSDAPADHSGADDALSAVPQEPEEDEYRDADALAETAAGDEPTGEGDTIGAEDEPAEEPDEAGEQPREILAGAEELAFAADAETEEREAPAPEPDSEAIEDGASETDAAEPEPHEAALESQPVAPAVDMSGADEERWGDAPAEPEVAAAPVATLQVRRGPRAVPEGATEADLRFMAAAIRLSRKHLGLTSTNPSVGTVIVRDGRIVGRGVTALGGRPHAETQALAEAGEAARGATAYVTLEPCAHHGRTPPCAEALVAAGIARVVGAAADPDDRVSGKGYAILRAGGIEVVEGLLAEEAADLMAGYLSRSARKRPEVTLKLALSADNMIGRRDAGQVQITGGIARAQVHMMRAQSDAILVGIGTVEADNPELNVRLPGLEERSPVRVVLDREARLPMMSKLALSARSLPLYVAVGPEASPVRKSSLDMLGVRFLPTETHEGRIALPELLEDLAGKGIGSVLVEGGAATAAMFLEDGVVDRIVLFRSPNRIGDDGIAAPLTPETVPADFRLVREARFGLDQYWEWTRD